MIPEVTDHSPVPMSKEGTFFCVACQKETRHCRVFIRVGRNSDWEMFSWGRMDEVGARKTYREVVCQECQRRWLHYRIHPKNVCDVIEVKYKGRD